MSDPLTRSELEWFYQVLLEREPDPTALAAYLEGGASKLDLLRGVTASDEFAERLRRARDRRAAASDEG